MRCSACLAIACGLFLSACGYGYRGSVGLYVEDESPGAMAVISGYLGSGPGIRHPEGWGFNMLADAHLSATQGNRIQSGVGLGYDAHRLAGVAGRLGPRLGLQAQSDGEFEPFLAVVAAFALGNDSKAGQQWGAEFRFHQFGGFAGLYVDRGEEQRRWSILPWPK